MSLSSALNTAKSSLAATQTQASVVSRNVAAYNTPGATRKYANVVTGPEGRVEVRSVAQSQNSILYRNMLDSTSELSGSSVVLEGLQRISETIGDTDGEGSAAALVSDLSDALESYAKSPHDYQFARAAVSAAQDLATNLNEATKTADVIRRDADDSLVLAAADMNALLADIQSLNDRVTAGTKGGIDVTDFVDQRDQAVTKLAGYVGVNAQVRGDNDLVLHTDSGVTLFDRVARPVEYTATSPLTPGQDGNAFKIDGTVVTGDNAYMPIRDGKVAGLVELRDETIVTYQTQLDEIARGLIAAFSETDQAGGGAAVAGMFTATGNLATQTSLTGSTFIAAGLAVGDTVSFDVTYEGKVYAATGTIQAGDLASGSTYAARLQATLANAKTADGTVLGNGKVSVAATGTALAMTATGVADQIDLEISNINATGLAGGLVAERSAAVAQTTYPGLAGSIRVAAGLAETPTKLRDGITYDYNATDSAGFTGRINALGTAMAQDRDFVAGGADDKASLLGFAASSLSWLQASRSEKLSQTDYRQTLLDKTNETLSDETGINLETELTLLLDLQRSFQASSKLITTVDEMLATLLQSV